MSDDIKTDERRQTSVTLPADVLLALQNAANRAGLSQNQLTLEALLMDARIAFELDLNARAREARP